MGNGLLCYLRFRNFKVLPGRGAPGVSGFEGFVVWGFVASVLSLGPVWGSNEKVLKMACRGYNFKHSKNPKP